MEEDQMGYPRLVLFRSAGLLNFSGARRYCRFFAVALFLLAIILPAGTFAGQPDILAITAGAASSADQHRGALADGVMPVPSSQLFIAYPPAAAPVIDSDPFVARPLGVGPVASGGNTLDVSVGFGPFSGPVDIYLAFTMPGDPQTLYAVTPDMTFQPYSLQSIMASMSSGQLPTGPMPYKANTTGPVSEHLLTMPVSSLPAGTYSVYVLASPAGSITHYYLWSTAFAVPAAGSANPGMPPACADVSGTWHYTNTGSVTCTIAGESDTESISGSGSITIAQNGCSISWTVPSIQVSRTGSVTGSALEVSGQFAVPLVPGVTITSNSYTAGGTINGSRIELHGEGAASGTYCEWGMCVPFSCSGSDTLILTR